MLHGSLHSGVRQKHLTEIKQSLRCICTHLYLIRIYISSCVYSQVELLIDKCIFVSSLFINLLTFSYSDTHADVTY